LSATRSEHTISGRCPPESDRRCFGVATNHQKQAKEGLSTAEEDRLDDADFAFPKERKEPIVDASHVRNAIARFDQVEGVSDAERDRAWKRIVAAAKTFDVDVSEEDWRELGKGSKAKNR
jgi:hypothetical protein